MPVETEIYILPNGEIVVADLPAELVSLIAAWSPGVLDWTPANMQDEEQGHVY